VERARECDRRSLRKGGPDGPRSRAGHAPTTIARVAQLAQANAFQPRAPWGDPVMREFVLALDTVNALAETSPGFVWRLHPGEGHGAVVVEDGATPVLVNLSVWAAYAPLHEFVYRSAHASYLRRRSRWFEPVSQPAAVLWWVDDGTEPTAAQAIARLRHLQRHGSTARAFGMRQRFEADGRPSPRRQGPPDRPPWRPADRRR
jgi:Domain of unknown function (DUF3291)